MSDQPAGMRSLYDRMTKPTPADMDTGTRLALLSRGEIERVMNTFAQALEHLAARRSDLNVEYSHDINSWTIHVDMKPPSSSPIVLPNG